MFEEGLQEGAPPKKVCIVGSGSWGSTVAKLVGQNVKLYPELFEEKVRMWVYEEMIEGRKLSEIINMDRENVKYLPDHKFSDNIEAVPDIVEATADADILIFVLPHQFIDKSCSPLVGKLKEGAQGISLIKGFAIVPEGGVRLMSRLLNELLGLPVSVLMGANIAKEVASGEFCETTIACLDQNAGALFKSLFETPYLRVSLVKDVYTTEICGALKNVVGCAAGFVDGLQLGDNTKAAVIRIGLMEMVKYVMEYHKEFEDAESKMLPKVSTFLESCGIADLVTTCYGGRNRRVCEAFVTSKKSFVQLETELLGGQKLQGPETAAVLNVVLNQKGLEEQFPLFTSVHKICAGDMQPTELVDQLRSHPVHHQGTEEYTQLLN